MTKKKVKDALPPVTPQVVRRDTLRRKWGRTSKYLGIMEKILKLGADEVLVVPRGCEEWPRTLSIVDARVRIATGLKILTSRANIRVRVERLDDGRIGISRTDV